MNADPISTSMDFEHEGRQYHMMRASDLQRDGMGLELQGDGHVIAEVFYADATRDLTLSVFEQALPLPVIERLIQAAKPSLPPAVQG